MKRFSPRRCATACLALAALVLLAGCVESNEKTTLAPDGSGTAVMKIIIDEAMAEQLREAMGGMGGMEAGNPAEDLDPDTLKEKIAKIEGLELVRAEIIEDEEKRTKTYLAEVKFDSLETFYRADLMPQTRGRLEQTEDGAWLLTREMGDPNMNSPEAQEMLAGFLMMLQPFLENLKMEASITLPGGVIETNGKQDGDRRVVWTVGFAELTSEIARKQTVKFGGEGISLTAFDTSKSVKEPAGPVTPSDDDEEGDDDGGMGGGG